MAQELEASQNENPQVEPEAPVLDVPKVTIDPLFHQLELGGLSAEAVDLRPTGQARLHMLTKGVVGDEFGVPVVMGNGMRPRTDQRHVSSQHIDELRQLVDARGAQDATDASDAGIVFAGLLDHAAVFEHVHGAKLEDRELARVKSLPALTEDDRSARL